MPYSQIQICEKETCRDLMNLGILPRKARRLVEIKIPSKYFPDFARGFFDGDGTVYIYKVNNVFQIKAGFVCASRQFIERFNKQLCQKIGIPEKSVHRKFDERKKGIALYDICFYISDCEKLASLLYENNPALYLARKRRIFEKWKSINRRHYSRQNYPSKIGWHLNKVST